jgi:molybdenum cofactor guanylyltransferase
VILGVILAGGLASRMGGGDKGLKTIGGRTILDRVVQRIGSQVERLIISANGDAERLADFDLPVIPDSLPDRPGPLAGILAAMDFAAEMTPANLVLSVAGDCPFLPTDLAPRLRALRTLHESRIVVAHSGGMAQPTIALWDISLRHDLRKALSHEGLRKIDLFTARYPTSQCEWMDEPYDPFFNANTPDDLVLAESIAARYADA